MERTAQHRTPSHDARRSGKKCGARQQRSCARSRRRRQAPDHRPERHQPRSNSNVPCCPPRPKSAHQRYNPSRADARSTQNTHSHTGGNPKTPTKAQPAPRPQPHTPPPPPHRTPSPLHSTPDQHPHPGTSNATTPSRALCKCSKARPRNTGAEEPPTPGQERQKQQARTNSRGPSAPRSNAGRRARPT